jgi:hypothetical protein
MPFQAQTQADIDAVLSRLLAVETELAEVESTAGASALRKALGTGTDEDTALIARLGELRAERDTLQMAREQAEQAERSRVEASRNRELSSKIRAGQQHVAALGKLMSQCAIDAENLLSHFAQAYECSKALHTLFPASNTLSLVLPGRLPRIVQAEIVRCQRDEGVRLFERTKHPWVSDFQRHATGEIIPMDQLLQLDLIRSRFKELLAQYSSSDAATSPGPASDDAAVSGEVPPSLEAAADFTDEGEFEPVPGEIVVP